MNEKVKVYPKPGLKVRTEDGQRHIADEGETVLQTRYIRRRLKAGDLQLVAQDAEPSGTTSKAPKAAKPKSADA